MNDPQKDWFRVSMALEVASRAVSQSVHAAAGSACPNTAVLVERQKESQSYASFSGCLQCMPMAYAICFLITVFSQSRIRSEPRTPLMITFKPRGAKKTAARALARSAKNNATPGDTAAEACIAQTGACRVCTVSVRMPTRCHDRASGTEPRVSLVRPQSRPPPDCTASSRWADQHALASCAWQCLASAFGGCRRATSRCWRCLRGGLARAAVPAFALPPGHWRLHVARATAASSRGNMRVTADFCCATMRLVRESVLRLNVEGSGLVQGLAEVKAKQVGGEARQNWHLHQRSASCHRSCRKTCPIWWRRTRSIREAHSHSQASLKLCARQLLVDTLQQLLRARAREAPSAGS